MVLLLRHLTNLMLFTGAKLSGVCNKFSFCDLFVLVSTMFLRKLLNKNDAKLEQKSAPPPGMQTMGASLQKRFARGVQYNSKLSFLLHIYF